MNDHKNWETEFQDFMANRASPPASLGAKVSAYVAKDLNPAFSRIISKLAVAQVTVGALSLLVCAQFGVGRGDYVSSVLMEHLGHMACMVICGGLFLGLPLLAALFFLSRSEIRAIRRFVYLPVFALGILSLLVFFCLGAELGVSVAAAWLMGGIVSGILTTEAGIALPRLFLRGVK